MEIFTLLKANIRHKKGSFVSVILLMTIASMVLTLILGMWENIYNGITQAHERLNTGNVLVMIDKNRLSDSLRDSIEAHELVSSVSYVDAIPSQKISYNHVDYPNNIVFFQELREGFCLLDSDGTGYLDTVPALKRGELYIPQGMKTNLACEIGDTITLTTAFGNYDFKITGIIEEPALGAAVIGWKNVYISQEDFEELCEAGERFETAGKGQGTVTTQVMIYKSDSCELTDGQFARQLNLDTGISDMGFGSITRDMCIRYTFLFPQTVCIILLVFVLILLAAIVVIMCHSVSTGIEMEYTTLGVMKALGFSKGRIRFIFALQYLIAQTAGAVAGIIPAAFLCRWTGNIFNPITGIVPLKQIPIGRWAVIILAVLLVSVVCLLFITAKVARISPVRAISGGKSEIYFDSRIQMPINKRALSSSLALRQFTANKRQYIGVILVISILVFFMTAMMVLGNLLNMSSAWKAMGILYTDIDISLMREMDGAEIEEMEAVIKEYSDIQDSYFLGGNYYYSVNGEQIMACVYSRPEEIMAVSDGRIPLYDNEIVMTEIAADNMGLKVGDKVIMRNGDKEAEYIISGLNQYMNDAGNNLSITVEAAKKLNDRMKVIYIGYVLADRSAAQEIAERLNEKYEGVLVAAYSEAAVDESYQLALNAITAVVYIFSALFAVVVVHMVCTKTFLRERTDIGIYKALGFTANKLRRQFAIRFLIMALIGSAIGTGLAAAFSGELLSSILRIIGISSVKVTFHIGTFAVPVITICVCFYLFAFMASSRIKRVAVRELVTE